MIQSAFVICIYRKFLIELIDCSLKNANLATYCQLPLQTQSLLNSSKKCHYWMDACFLSNQCHNMQIGQSTSVYKNERAAKLLTFFVS